MKTTIYLKRIAAFLYTMLVLIIISSCDSKIRDSEINDVTYVFNFSVKVSDSEGKNLLSASGEEALHYEYSHNDIQILLKYEDAIISQSFDITRNNDNEVLLNIEVKGKYVENDDPVKLLEITWGGGISDYFKYELRKDGDKVKCVKIWYNDELKWKIENAGLPVFSVVLPSAGLDDCHPMVRYAVAFQYTNHTGTKNRFHDDVKGIRLYVFDENRLIYTTMNELSPYRSDFKIPLDLPVGNYNIIAWGNVLAYDDFDFPESITKGTSFDEARLLLQREANNLSKEELEKLFYGVLRDVEIYPCVNRVDTMSLVNNTNKVRIVLHWDHSSELNNTDEVLDYDEISVRLSASNGAYDFSNNFVGKNNVMYKPWAYYYTDGILNADKNEWLTMSYYSPAFSKVSNTCVYDFSILRMIVGSPIYLTVEHNDPKVPDPYNLLDNPIDVIQTFTTYFDNQGVFVSQRQNLFDRNERYRIDIYLNR